MAPPSAFPGSVSCQDKTVSACEEGLDDGTLDSGSDADSPLGDDVLARDAEYRADDKELLAGRLNCKGLSQSLVDGSE